MRTLAYLPKSIRCVSRLAFFVAALTCFGRSAAAQSPACQVGASQTDFDLDQPGATGTVSITVNDQNCVWTATANAPWITISAQNNQATNGTVRVVGNGTLNYMVASNPGSAERTSTIEITVQGCIIGLFPSTATFYAAGGHSTFALSAACSWNAAASVPWITVDTGHGTGDATVGYTISQNTSGMDRSATINVNGRPFSIVQTGECSFVTTPPGITVRSEGGSARIAVSTASDCPWIAQTTDSWLNLLDGAGRTGSGTVTYTVAANTTSAERKGSLTVAGQEVPVTQLTGVSIGFLTVAGIDPNASDPPGLNKFFGYYNPYGFTTGAQPDRIDVSAIDDQSTVNFVHVDAARDPASSAVMSRVFGPAGAIKGALVWASPLDTVVTSPTQGKLPLPTSSDYTTWVDAVRPLVNSGKVAAILLDSEPACNRIDDNDPTPLGNIPRTCAQIAGDLQNSAVQIHGTFPNMPLLLIFGAPKFQTYVEDHPSVLPDVRVLAWDCYQPLDVCDPQTTLHRMELNFRYDAKLFVFLPPAFASVTEATGSHQEDWLKLQDTLAIANQSAGLIADDPLLVALMPFVWTYRKASGGINVEGQDPTHGNAALPRAGARENHELHRRFLTLGNQITGRPVPSDSPAVVGTLLLSKNCTPTADTDLFSCRLHVEWTLAHGYYGAGIRLYDQNTARSQSAWICQINSVNEATDAHVCDEPRLDSPPALVRRGTYFVELVPIGADPSPPALITTTITVP